jgi:hypothetical protein
MTRVNALQVAVIAGLLVAACDGARDTELDDQGVTNLTQPTEPGDPGETGEDPPLASDEEPGSTSGSSTSGGSSGSTGTKGCQYKDNVDHDGDGLSFADGDCNDCDADMRPGKLDEPGNGKDEDCSGKADDDGACDGAIALASSDAVDGARALGVCKSVTPGKAGWGVVSAKYVKPDGTVLSHATSYGILPSFGANQPPSGKAMLALSTGSARAPGQAEYAASVDKGYTHGTPAGWPKSHPACVPAVTPTVAKDGAALKLEIKVPVDAHSMSFEHAFFTKDYSQDVCSTYTDQFVVIMSPPPAGAVDGNIVFDASGGAVNVNSPLIQACSGGTFKNITYACGLGTSLLSGTGFDGKASTGWLRTTTPVEPGSTITLLFAVWDSGDGTYDTTVLLDSLRFWTKSVTKTQTVQK